MMLGTHRTCRRPTSSLTMVTMTINCSTLAALIRVEWLNSTIKWLDNVKDWARVGLPYLVHLAEDRKRFKEFIHRTMSAAHGVWHLQTTVINVVLCSRVWGSGDWRRTSETVLLWRRRYRRHCGRTVNRWNRSSRTVQRTVLQTTRNCDRRRQQVKTNVHVRSMLIHIPVHWLSCWCFWCTVRAVKKINYTVSVTMTMILLLHSCSLYRLNNTIKCGNYCPIWLPWQPPAARSCRALPVLIRYYHNLQGSAREVAHSFFTARALLSRYMPWSSVCLSVCVCVCVCVCPSQFGVLLKRLNIGIRKQRHTIAQGI